MKYDGYRMMLIREQDRVRLISRGGHDRARRFPFIVTAALKLRQEHFVLDGETVVLGPDGAACQSRSSAPHASAFWTFTVGNARHPERCPPPTLRGAT